MAAESSQVQPAGVSEPGSGGVPAEAAAAPVEEAADRPAGAPLTASSAETDLSLAAEQEGGTSAPAWESVELPPPATSRRRRKRGGEEREADKEADEPARAASEDADLDAALDAAWDADDEGDEPEQNRGEEDDSDEEPDNLSDWNVPSWQELIASLYRPDR